MCIKKNVYTWKFKTKGNFPARVCVYIEHVCLTISMFLKSIGLFCKRAVEKRIYSAKETCNHMCCSLLQVCVYKELCKY